MNLWSDLDYDMHPVPLDLDTADRLLAGALAPEDAPPGYAKVARLLEGASAEATPDELARETEVVTLMAAEVRLSSSTESASPRKSFMPFALSRPRVSAAAVAAALACSAGLASAGALPGAAQDVASAMLAKVGISVPGSNESAGDHPNARGSSADTSDGDHPNVRGSSADTSDVAKGSGISGLATTTELTGVNKGAAISSAASDGKSQAGQHGSASGESARVDKPNGGGTGTADTASGGKSTNGSSTADTASGGASSAGSGNASSGEEAADIASGGHSTAGSDNESSDQSHKP
jgi:hypothetical protein